jgi:hypothetical protein
MGWLFVGCGWSSRGLRFRGRPARRECGSIPRPPPTEPQTASGESPARSFSSCIRPLSFPFARSTRDEENAFDQHFECAGNTPSAGINNGRPVRPRLMVGRQAASVWPQRHDVGSRQGEGQKWHGFRACQRGRSLPGGDPFTFKQRRRHAARSSQAYIPIPRRGHWLYSPESSRWCGANPERDPR